MDTFAITPAQPLANFCAAFLSRNREHWPPDEGTLAHEFIEQFPIRQFSTPEKIVAFAQSLGIEASLKALPDVLHGFNCLTGDRAIVLLSEQETFPGSREHTFFHELREVME